MEANRAPPPSERARSASVSAWAVPECGASQRQRAVAKRMSADCFGRRRGGGAVPIDVPVDAEQKAELPSTRRCRRRARRDARRTT